MPPALSFAVPFGPLPVFTAPSEESEDFHAWQTPQDDESSTIIPPTPPRSQRVPTAAPPPDKETIANNIPSSFVVQTESSDDEKEAVTNMELPTAPPFSTNRPTGTRVTFGSHSHGRIADFDSHHHNTRPPITVLWDTATFGTRARSLENPKVATAEHDEREPPSTGRREPRSRSRVVKSLTPDNSEIIVNIPGPSAQRAVPYRRRSPEDYHAPSYLSTRAITSLPLQTHDSGATPRLPPTATAPPTNHRSYRRRATSTATHRDRPYFGPPSVTVVSPEFLDAPMRPTLSETQAFSSRHGRKAPEDVDYSDRRGDVSPRNVSRKPSPHYAAVAGRRTSIAEFPTNGVDGHRVGPGQSRSKGETGDSRHPPLFKDASGTISHPPVSRFVD